MEHAFTSGQKIVRDDPPMASPPQRLGTHNGAGLVTIKVAEPSQSGAKFITHDIVSIIVEAVIMPECIDAWSNIAILAAQSTKRCDMFISDSQRRQ